MAEYVPSQARRPRQNYPKSKKYQAEKAKEDFFEDYGDPANPPAPLRPDLGRDEEGNLTPRQQLRLSTQLLAEANPPNLGRAPENDEEKRLVLRSLVYMKAANLTDRQCAEQLSVSERTIANYRRDEAYLELQQELFARAREDGYTTIGAMVNTAMEKLYELMGAKSEFVQFKSAEYILKMAGYELPPESKAAESRDAVVRFLESIRAQNVVSGMNVNITVNQPPGSPQGQGSITQVREEPMVVEALPMSVPQLFEERVVSGQQPQVAQPAEIPEELQQYYQQVLPGGRLPWDTGEDDPQTSL